MGPGWPQHSSSRVTRFHEVGRLVHALAGVSGLSDGSPSVRYSAQQCWERDAIIRFPFCIIESVDSICRGYLCTASGAGSVLNMLVAMSDFDPMHAANILYVIFYWVVRPSPTSFD